MKNTASIIGETIMHWWKCNAPRMGAALSYYAIFSIAPLLFLLVTLAGSIFNQDLVQGKIVSHIQSFFGADLARFAESLINQSSRIEGGYLSHIISIFLILLGAIGVFLELEHSLRKIWQTPKFLKENTTFTQKIKKFFIDRLVVFSLIPIAGLILLISISFSIFLSFVPSDTILPFVGTIPQGLEVLISFFLSTVLFTIIFKVLPNTKVPLKQIWFGSIVTSILFLLGRFFILFYLHNLVQITVYGSAGILVAMLIWVYYSAQVFLIGASFTYVLAKRSAAKTSVLPQ